MTKLEFETRLYADRSPWCGGRDKRYNRTMNKVMRSLPRHARSYMRSYTIKQIFVVAGWLGESDNYG